MSTGVEDSGLLTREQEQVFELRGGLEGCGMAGRTLDLLAEVVASGSWRKVPAEADSGETFGSFAEFVEAGAPFGLASDIGQVRALVRSGHPDEGVPRVRAEMERLREGLAELVGPDPEADAAGGDARLFGAFTGSGGWALALLVARATSQDGSAEKIPFEAFAEQADSTAELVRRFHDGWERAAADGLVPAARGLRPGAETALPHQDAWPHYFDSAEDFDSARDAESVEEIQSAPIELLVSDAPEPEPEPEPEALPEPEPVKAAEESREVVVAMVAADPGLRKEAAAEAKRIQRIGYLQKVLDEGQAKTPSGQFVEIALDDHMDEFRALVENPQANVEALAEAYEIVQDLVGEAVVADADVLVREQRTKFGKAIKATVRSIDSIDPDDLLAVVDDTLAERIADLQQKVNELAALVVR